MFKNRQQYRVKRAQDIFYKDIGKLPLVDTKTRKKLKKNSFVTSILDGSHNSDLSEYGTK